jgi:hypothetical protein
MASRQGPPVSHLLFVDDWMIFSKANAREEIVIHDCLSTYYNWSEQKINSSKSSYLHQRKLRPKFLDKWLDSLVFIWSNESYI